MKHSIIRIASMRMLLAAILFLTGVYAPAQVGQDVTSDSVSAAKTRCPVAPYGDTLFFITTRAGSFRPQARAEAIVQRILQVGSAPFYAADSLRIDTVEGAHDIVYGDVVLMSISKHDALAQGRSPDELAVAYRTGSSRRWRPIASR